MTFHSSPEGTAFAGVARRRPQTAHSAHDGTTAQLSGLPLAEALIRAGVARDIAFRAAGMADPIPFEPGRPISEKEEQRRIRRAAMEHGGKVYWLSQARKTGQTPGIPDLWIAFPAFGMWWETKTAEEVASKDGGLSPFQQDFRDECQRNGTAWGSGTHDDFCRWMSEKWGVISDTVVTIQPVGE